MSKTVDEYEDIIYELQQRLATKTQLVDIQQAQLDQANARIHTLEAENIDQHAAVCRECGTAIERDQYVMCDPCADRLWRAHVDQVMANALRLHDAINDRIGERMHEHQSALSRLP